jgi:hypothetical protein
MYDLNEYEIQLLSDTNRLVFGCLKEQINFYLSQGIWC